MCSGHGWVYARAVPNPRRISAGCAVGHAGWGCCGLRRAGAAAGSRCQRQRWGWRWLRIHAANGPASGEDTAPDSWLVVLPKNEDTALHGLPTALLKARHTDQFDWSLPAHRRGTRGGMDAATELTGTYLQRVTRWWAGKGPAARPKIRLSAANTQIIGSAGNLSSCLPIANSAGWQEGAGRLNCA